MALVSLGGVLLLANQAFAASTGTEPYLSFEGKIVTSAGVNVTDGNYNMEFKICPGDSYQAADSQTVSKITKHFLYINEPLFIAVVAVIVITLLWLIRRYGLRQIYILRRKA
jgi:hypothetical protein